MVPGRVGVLVKSGSMVGAGLEGRRACSSAVIFFVLQITKRERYYAGRRPLNHALDKRVIHVLITRDSWNV